MTTGMAVLGWQESLPMRVIALDSVVNLLAIFIATVAGYWNQRSTGAG
jgi:multisubunit Na+/H+ antiporter MnhF subunit